MRVTRPVSGERCTSPAEYRKHCLAFGVPKASAQPAAEGIRPYKTISMKCWLTDPRAHTLLPQQP
jgi:hypothetical protein